MKTIHLTLKPKTCWNPCYGNIFTKCFRLCHGGLLPNKNIKNNLHRLLLSQLTQLLDIKSSWSHRASLHMDVENISFITIVVKLWSRYEIHPFKDRNLIFRSRYEIHPFKERNLIFSSLTFVSFGVLMKLDYKELLAQFGIDSNSSKNGGWVRCLGMAGPWKQILQIMCRYVVCSGREGGDGYTTHDDVAQLCKT